MVGMFGAIFVDTSGHHLNEVPFDCQMSLSSDQIKDSFLLCCLPTNVNRGSSVALKTDDQNSDSDQNDLMDFSSQCLVRAIRVGDTAGLMTRINYQFPGGIKVSAKEAFHHAKAINQLLVHSGVFVAQDIDGDRSYYLQLDSVLKGPYERENLTKFLQNVSEDVKTVLQYFGCSSGAIAPYHSMLATCFPDCISA